MVLPKKLMQSVTQGKVAANIRMPLLSRHIPISNSSAELIALQYLRTGAVIALPTDTVYGLACDCTSVSAISNLYAIKCREATKPLAICLGETRFIRAWANVEHLPHNLLNALLPGPVTLILNSLDNNLDKSLSLNGKIAIRIPDNPFIRRLACRLGSPIALTSANLSNEPSAAELVGFSSIWDKIPAIFDGGKLEISHGVSTIVDISESGLYRILRKGAALTETTDILRKFKLKLVQEGVKVAHDDIDRRS